MSSSSKRARTDPTPQVGLKLLLSNTDAWSAVGAFLVAGGKALNELRRPAICMHCGGSMLSFLEPSSRAGFWLVTHWSLRRSWDTPTTEYYKKSSFLSLSVFLKTSLRRMAETQSNFGHGGAGTSAPSLYFSEARPADDYARFYAGYRSLCKETLAKDELLTSFFHHKAAKKFCLRFEENIPALSQDYHRYDDFCVVVMQRCFSMRKFHGNPAKKSNADKFGLFCEDVQALLRGDITLKLPCKRLEPILDCAIDIHKRSEREEEEK